MDKLEHWTTLTECGIVLEVSSLGRIRRQPRDLVVAPRDNKGRTKGNFRKSIPGGEMKQWLDKNGYMKVSFMVNGKKYKKSVHRLVATAFVDGFFEGATVDHIDGNRLNNAASNLEWVTRAENTRRQNRDGRGVPKGEDHPNAKLQNSQLAEIKLLREQGLSYQKIGDLLGVSGSLVHKILTGKRRVQ